ncbi:ADP-ribosylglycohydrolase family protein [uncultured Ferrimonas sp.]|uniref:ADP-ribosylglycohydrolase family protein n=1 Tax=uncultured Ferrimonas sp. TaxID=432640 RepID=UPI0026052EED|nr:ADP-ribosylglycohydrolase family protein [uncultured Ferrimonas sp.]
MHSDSFHPKARGCLLGLALGDALGTTLEFKAKGSFTPILDMMGGGPFNLRAGQWTDDTSMALCLADSLLATGYNDPIDQNARYLRWYRHGENSVTGHCFDIGNTVRAALHRFERSGDGFCGSRDPFSAGNGSLMRLAPVVLAYCHPFDHQLLWQMAADSSRTTHSEALTVSACQVMASAIAVALTLPSGDKNQWLSQWREQLQPLPVAPKLKPLLAGSFIDKTEAEIVGSGYVLASLEAALWAFWHSDNFEQGALLAANLGDDADTTAAIFGQLAGAFYGLDGLPQHWLDKLAWRQQIEQRAQALWQLTPLPSNESILLCCRAAEPLTAAADPRHKASDDNGSALNHWYESVYQHGLILPGFDWMAWQQQIPSNHDRPHWLRWIAQLDRRDCCQLLTQIVRSDRFVDGNLTEAINSGTLAAIHQRLFTLTKETRL